MACMLLTQQRDYVSFSYLFCSKSDVYCRNRQSRSILFDVVISKIRSALDRIVLVIFVLVECDLLLCLFGFVFGVMRALLVGSKFIHCFVPLFCAFFSEAFGISEGECCFVVAEC